MNKKLLAAAVAAAVVAAPAAFAESTVYGKFHASVDSVDSEVNNSTTTDNWQVSSRSSRLGFKGSEDLGSGLKATYQLELSVDVTDGSGVTGTNRNTFIGLAGGFGEFRVGRHDTPAKMAFYAAGTDVLGDSIMDLHTGTTGVFSEVRASNTIAYLSPNFSGFSVAAAIVPGEQSGVTKAGDKVKLKGSLYGLSTSTTITTSNKNSNDGLADSYSLGLMYSGNGLRAGLGYEKLAGPDIASGVTDDSKMFQLGASYTMNNFMVGAHYEKTKNYANVKDVDFKAWALSAKATFGNNAITAVYTDANVEVDGLSGDVDGDAWGIGAEHNFSKRTKVYAAYATNDVKQDIIGSDEADSKSFSLGMIHNF